MIRDSRYHVQTTSDGKKVDGLFNNMSVRRSLLCLLRPITNTQRLTCLTGQIRFRELRSLIGAAGTLSGTERSPLPDITPSRSHFLIVANAEP